ncbi:MAG: hypothetical protein IKQ46_08550 [Bacteroidales bacterium]|nr:hypothetical protein [Bacteroidales bacterium]
MKKSIILISLLPCIAFAQKEDYNWALGNYIINFDSNPPQKTEVVNPTNAYNSSCISDRNGNLLFRYGGNKLWDINENQIFTNVGSLMHSPSLIPFPYNNDKTLFFYSVVGKGVYCSVISNENPQNITTLKTFSSKNTKFIFIQQKNTENIWFLSSVNNKIEISLITKDGFSEPKILDIPYDVSSSTVSLDNSKIIFGIGTEKSVLFDFDSENGILKENFQFNLYSQCSFSASGKYIYNIEKNDVNSCNIVRYNIESATDEQTLLNSKFLIKQIPAMSETIPKIAPDKNIYIKLGFSLYAIYDCDTENAHCEPNAITFDKIVSNFPFTFHYNFDNPCQNPPSASFDNTKVCFGEPLKITLFGIAPFEIFYTFNGEEKSVKTSETEYLMNNIPGKYKITKVSDQSCDFIPNKNVESEILSKIKPPKIIKE